VVQGKLPHVRAKLIAHATMPGRSRTRRSETNSVLSKRVLTGSPPRRSRPTRGAPTARRGFLVSSAGMARSVSPSCTRRYVAHSHGAHAWLRKAEPGRPVLSAVAEPVPGRISGTPRGVAPGRVYGGRCCALGIGVLTVWTPEVRPRESLPDYQPRARHSGIEPRSLPSVESFP
jgi:hypothetical protein